MILLTLQVLSLARHNINPMTVLPQINKFRRSIMRKLTQSVGDASEAHPLEIAKINRILISRPNNRLGNLLLITPLIQEINETFPQAKIDLFVRGGLAKIVFANYQNIDRIIALPGKPFDHLIQYFSSWRELRKQSYDLVINVDGESSSGRLSTRWARSKHKIFGDIPVSDGKCVHMARKPAYQLRAYLSGNRFDLCNQNVATLNLNLSAAELTKGKILLRKLVANNKPTIAIFTYATGAKCYPESWWRPFYQKLQDGFPHYNIIEILPKENVSQINFSAPTFLSNDVREIGALMANTEVFIGADSGIMHLASASKIPTIGLFSASDPQKYEPYGNDSRSIDTNFYDADACIGIIRDVVYKNSLKYCDFS